MRSLFGLGGVLFFVAACGGPTTAPADAGRGGATSSTTGGQGNVPSSGGGVLMHPSDASRPPRLCACSAGVASDAGPTCQCPLPAWTTLSCPTASALTEAWCATGETVERTTVPAACGSTELAMTYSDTHVTASFDGAGRLAHWSVADPFFNHVCRAGDEPVACPPGSRCVVCQGPRKTDSPPCAPVQ